MPSAPSTTTLTLNSGANTLVPVPGACAWEPKEPLELRCVGGKVKKGLGEPGIVRMGGLDGLGSTGRGHPLGPSILVQMASD